MGYISKEMTERARKVCVLDYVLQFETNNVKRVGSSYRLKDHDSLAVSDKGFYWHSRGLGGVTALDFLIKVRGYDFVDAVSQILRQQPLEKDEHLRTKILPPSLKNQIYNKSSFEKVSIQKLISNPHPLILPRRNKDNYKVIAYLHNRGIDKDLITDCINRGVLYQSTIHHNAVFLGKDEHEKTRFAAMRSVTGDFKRDADGSCKRYGFVIPPKNDHSLKLSIFESPIDCLSHQTLCRKGYLPDFNGWRLSLGGTCLDALTHFLEQHPNINNCLICLDDDEAGNKAAIKIAETLYINTERAPPIHGKDWNDTLKSMLQSKNFQTTQHNNDICL